MKRMGSVDKIEIKYSINQLVYEINYWKLSTDGNFIDFISLDCVILFFFFRPTNAIDTEHVYSVTLVLNTTMRALTLPKQLVFCKTKREGKIWKNNKRNRKFYSNICQFHYHFYLNGKTERSDRWLARNESQYIIVFILNAPCMLAYCIIPQIMYFQFICFFRFLLLLFSCFVHFSFMVSRSDVCNKLIENISFFSVFSRTNTNLSTFGYSKCHIGKLRLFHEPSILLQS